MNYLLVTVISLAFWHFFYEAIIAPSVRLSLRNRLFKLRDELRKEKIQGIDSSDEMAFSFVHEGINTFISRLPSLTIWNIRRVFRECENNPHLKQSIETHFDAVNKAKNKTIRKTFEKTNEVIAIAFVINAGGWLIYIIPIIVALAFMNSIGKLISELVVAPTKDMERIFPQAACA